MKQTSTDYITDLQHLEFEISNSVFAGHVLRGQERVGSWRWPNGYVTELA